VLRSECFAADDFRPTAHLVFFPNGFIAIDAISVRFDEVIEAPWP
jgi:hypothetical protein